MTELALRGNVFHGYGTSEFAHSAFATTERTRAQDNIFRETQDRRPSAPSWVRFLSHRDGQVLTQTTESSTQHFEPALSAFNSSVQSETDHARPGDLSSGDALRTEADRGGCASRQRDRTHRPNSSADCA